ncbi:MAG: response regulator [Candidatus Nanoarchaeia archaeon]|nr:response regulator [Candidatus Nanoarchaeia archaeon]
MTKKVLIVEDDASALKLISRILESINLEFLIAKDSSTALRFLNPEKIGFALVDYSLEDGETGDKVAEKANELGIPYFVTSDGAYCDPHEVFDNYKPLGYVSKAGVINLGDIVKQICEQ